MTSNLTNKIVLKQPFRAKNDYPYIPVPLKLRPYGAIKICLLLLLFLQSIQTPQLEWFFLQIFFSTATQFRKSCNNHLSRKRTKKPTLSDLCSEMKSITALTSLTKLLIVKGRTPQAERIDTNMHTSLAKYIRQTVNKEENTRSTLSQIHTHVNRCKTY